MNVLVFWMGTMGDALPFFGISAELARRGHKVTVFGNGYFHGTSDSLGLPFVDLITPAQYEDRLIERAKAQDLESLKVNSKYVVEDLPTVHRAVHEHYVPNQTMVVSQSYLMGSRIAQEELGFPMATVHLYPMLLRSAMDGPWWLPRGVIRFGHRLIDGVVDAALGKDVNALRATRNLPPVKRVFDQWWLSPDLVLAMFPSWFSKPQPDWPAQTVQAGFPFFNPQHGSKLSPATEQFLASGSPPIVFAHTQAVKYLDGYFEHSIKAARDLGYRALLLGGHKELLTIPMPEGVMHSPAEPHELLLPRCKAIVHHGGIGTAFAAMKAATPQICVPQMLDQPFNAKLLEKMGVSATIPWKKYGAALVTRTLNRLLENPATTKACAVYSKLTREQPDPCTIAADAIEKVMKSRLHSS